MATMDSLYAGKCTECAGGIAKGDRIEYLGKGQTFHFDCRPLSARPPDWRKFEQNGFTFVDLETSGINPNKEPDQNNNPGPCAIVQLAAIATSNNFVVQGLFSTLIKPNPNLLYLPEAMAVHGKPLEELEKAPDEFDALMAFIEFCNKFDYYRFAGFRCSFDQGFLNAAYERQGIVDKCYQEPALDIYEIAREQKGAEIKAKHGNNKLVSVAAFAGIKTDGAHDALTDIWMTVQAARHYVPRIRNGQL